MPRPILKSSYKSLPKVQKLIKAGINREQYHFRLNDSQMDKIFSGPAPANDGTILRTLAEPAE